MNLLKPALLGLLLAASSSAYSMTNQQLVDYCTDAAAVINPKKVPKELVVSYNQCLAFTDGFIAGFYTAPALLTNWGRIKQEDWPFLCAPDGFSAKSLSVDVVKYVRDGGEYDPDGAANSILMRVMLERHYCPAKKQ